MRVLNVQLKHIHGGNPQVALDYTRALQKAGNEVIVLTNPADPFFEHHKAVADRVIPAKRLGEFGSYDIVTLLYFKAVLLRFKPDAVIVHEGRSASLMQKAAAGRMPVIDVNHSRGCKQSQKMDATIVTNTSRCSYYKEHMPLHRTYFIPNGLRTEDQVKSCVLKPRNPVPRIGVMSRLVWHKGVDIFIDALHHLQARQIPFQATIAGNGEEYDKIKDKMTAYGLENHVALIGYADVKEFYQAIDIFCFPSRQEEFGLVLLWAYKYGVPIVTTDTEGPSDVVEPEVDALMVPKNDPVLLADALQRVIEDETLAERLAKAGYEKLRSKYSLVQLSGQLQMLLEEVVGMREERVAA